jgi:CMP/dCMP kinase
VPFTGVLALDGAAGTGKSTVARTLARRLRARYLDTGAMYRAATWAVLRSGTDPDDADAVEGVVAASTIEIGTDPDHEHVQVDDTPVRTEIRGDAVTQAVSAVSAVPGVRRRLVAQQRELIGGGGIVVEGRDIGTVVAPCAHTKIYLTAAAPVRALRRSRQHGRDEPAAVAATQADIHRRDSYDSGRSTDPLRPAEDAVELDTTEMSVDAVVERVLSLLPEDAVR